MTPYPKGRKKWTEKIRFTGNRYTCHKCQTEHDPDNMVPYCASCFASNLTKEDRQSLAAVFGFEAGMAEAKIELERLRNIEAAAAALVRDIDKDEEGEGRYDIAYLSKLRFALSPAKPTEEKRHG